MGAQQQLLKSPTYDIATRAVGVGQPVLYRLFGDKQGLLDALADQGLERYARRKGELKTTEDPVADLRAGWDDHLLFAEENPGLYQLMFSPRPWSKSTARATVTDLLVHTLTRCAAAGALAVEPLSAAAMILSANVGLALSNIAAPTAFTDVAIISQQLRDALFAAVLAAPPTPQHADAAGIVASALQLRAQLSLTGTATALDPAELFLLDRWLERLMQNN